MWACRRVGVGAVGSGGEVEKWRSGEVECWSAGVLECVGVLEFDSFNRARYRLSVSALSWHRLLAPDFRLAAWASGAESFLLCRRNQPPKNQSL